MRLTLVAISFITIFASLIPTTPWIHDTLGIGTAPAYAINIWEGARCSTDTAAARITTGGPTGPCDFCDALVVAKNIILLLLEFATIAATIMIVVGALMMMFSGGSEERFATGKRAILNAAIGLAIALASWLIVNIVIQFLAPGDTIVPWAQINCS
ncbi:MAG: hypothetical protein V1885_03000 [Candidatus Brennerbacteria bacterium]